MKRFMRASLSWPHPIYIRMGKGGDPVVSKEENGFTIGKGIVMRPAEGTGHVLLIACGVMTERALKAADILSAKGHTVEVIHIHTVKPLDEALILSRAAAAGSVFTIEEHTLIGGLGSAVVDLLVEQGKSPLSVIRKLGLADKFAKNYGSQDDLLEINGLLAPQIAATVEETLIRAAA
jgi:transketolase